MVSPLSVSVARVRTRDDKRLLPRRAGRGTAFAVAERERRKARSPAIDDVWHREVERNEPRSVGAFDRSRENAREREQHASDDKRGKREGNLKDHSNPERRLAHNLGREDAGTEEALRHLLEHKANGRKEHEEEQ
jgi:hypothetical protein